MFYVFPSSLLHNCPQSSAKTYGMLNRSSDPIYLLPQTVTSAANMEDEVNQIMYCCLHNYAESQNFVEALQVVSPNVAALDSQSRVEVY